ncbi:MAG: anti-sigma factor antagonist [Gaiellales bacterium]|nr:anti-sigma factor antagonist [Gaiellales bacterium]
MRGILALMGTVQVRFLSPEIAVLALTGEHDLSTLGQVKPALAAARPAQHIVVDFSACTFADSVVITTILRAWRDQQDAGGEISIVAPLEPNHVRRAMELMGIDRFLPLHTSREAAVAALPRRRRLRLSAVSERIDAHRNRAEA